MLLQNAFTMYEQQELCDAHLNVSMQSINQIGTNVIGVHKLHLAAVSGFFRGMFTTPMQPNMDIDVAQPVLQAMLRFLYTGKCEVKDADELISLCELADQYAIPSLLNIGLARLEAEIKAEDGFKYLDRKVWPHEMCRLFIAVLMNTKNETFFPNMTAERCVKILNAGLGSEHAEQVKERMTQYLYIHDGMQEVVCHEVWSDLSVDSLRWIFGSQGKWKMRFVLGDKFEYSSRIQCKVPERFNTFIEDQKWVKHDKQFVDGVYRAMYKSEDMYLRYEKDLYTWIISDTSYGTTKYAKGFSSAVHPVLSSGLSVYDGSSYMLATDVEVSCTIRLNRDDFSKAMLAWVEKNFQSVLDLSNMTSSFLRESIQTALLEWLGKADCLTKKGTLQGKALEVLSNLPGSEDMEKYKWCEDIIAKKLDEACEYTGFTSLGVDVFSRVLDKCTQGDDVAKEAIRKWISQEQGHESSTESENESSDEKSAVDSNASTVLQNGDTMRTQRLVDLYETGVKVDLVVSVAGEGLGEDGLERGMLLDEEEFWHKVARRVLVSDGKAIMDGVVGREGIVATRLFAWARKGDDSVQKRNVRMNIFFIQELFKR